MVEINTTNKKFQKELNSGVVALVLLSMLYKSKRPQYGYQIAKRMETAGIGTVSKLGTLYPVLRSLEANNLLQSKVKPSVSGPPRRYYTITSQGRETLGHWIKIWNQTKSNLDKILKGKYYD